ncbi:MAG: hypothetical protein ACR2KZ_11955 [Segetibacter sp.]
MKRVTNGFGELSFANFSNLLAYIIQCMTNNAYFVTLQAQVAALIAFLSCWGLLAWPCVKAKGPCQSYTASSTKLFTMNWYKCHLI